ncbi:MAG TPA: NADH-quinone oxidoreductase subunit I [Elusimicrobiota bacterium]|jgi:NADH-quinone oxidoreductase subunit I|nr:NADH-quinone oxidoreductase subunit I [Elusimicrobiota bacterium]
MSAPESLGRHPVRAVRRPEMGFKERVYLVEVWRGLRITFRHLLVNLYRHARRAAGWAGLPGAVTIQYPDDPAVVAKRARTRHRLLKREDGTPRCVACMLCETVCPAKCIQIVSSESPEVMIEKRPKSFQIDLGLCVFCGYCVEACPEDAIRMDTGQVEMASFSREGMLWKMPDLLGERSRPQ